MQLFALSHVETIRISQPPPELRTRALRYDAPAPVTHSSAQPHRCPPLCTIRVRSCRLLPSGCHPLHGTSCCGTVCNKLYSRQKNHLQIVRTALVTGGLHSYQPGSFWAQALYISLACTLSVTLYYPLPSPRQALQQRRRARLNHCSSRSCSSGIHRVPRYTYHFRATSGESGAASLSVR